MPVIMMKNFPSVSVRMEKSDVFPWQYQKPAFRARLKGRPNGPGDTFTFLVDVPGEHFGREVVINGNSPSFVGFYFDSPMPDEATNGEG